MRKLAAYPPQKDLTRAPRLDGRIERTIFVLRRISDANLLRRAQFGLNTAEAHNSLKRATALGGRGEIRDNTAEGQHLRMADLHLFATIIIHWNTAWPGEILAGITASGTPPDPKLLARVLPLDWEHIILTGEHRRPASGMISPHHAKEVIKCLSATGPGCTTHE